MTPAGGCRRPPGGGARRARRRRPAGGDPRGWLPADPRAGQPREEAAELASAMDRAIEARDAGRANGAGPGLYEEFDSDPRFEAPDRPWITETGGVLVADSPKLMFDTLDLFERTGLRRLIAGLPRRAPRRSRCRSRPCARPSPDTPGAWHQDGALHGRREGDERLALALALRRRSSRARPGSRATSTTIVATGTEGAYLETQVSDAVAREAAGESGVLRPDLRAR